MRWKALAAVALLVAGVGAVAWAVTGGPSANGDSQTQYLTADAQTGDVAATVVATGALDRATTYALAFGQAPTAGATAASSGTWSVTDVAVAAGDAVTKGQTLAKADSSSLKRDLVAARAQLKVAQDQKRLADTQLGDATTTAAKRQGRISVNNAIAQVTNARASVSQLEDQIARATIVAPEDGVVTGRDHRGRR